MISPKKKPGKKKSREQKKLDVLLKQVKKLKKKIKSLKKKSRKIKKKNLILRSKLKKINYDDEENVEENDEEEGYEKGEREASYSSNNELQAYGVGWEGGEEEEVRNLEVSLNEVVSPRQKMYSDTFFTPQGQIKQSPSTKSKSRIQTNPQTLQYEQSHDYTVRQSPLSQKTFSDTQANQIIKTPFKTLTEPRYNNNLITPSMTNKKTDKIPMSPVKGTNSMNIRNGIPSDDFVKRTLFESQ